MSLEEFFVKKKKMDKNVKDTWRDLPMRKFKILKFKIKISFKS